MNSLLSSSSSPNSTMNSTNASSSNPSKKIKLTIIPPRQLFINIYSDEDITTTPSLTTTFSSPTPPNAPSKTTSINQTSSSQENTSSSFHSKLQISPPSSHEPNYPPHLNPLLDNISDYYFSSPPSSHEPNSPPHLNPLLDNISDVPPRPLNPQPLQSHPSLDITLSLSPITPLDHTHDTTSPPQPQPPIMGHPLFYNYHDYHGSTCICSLTLDRYLSDHRPILLSEINYDYGPIPFRLFHYWFEVEVEIPQEKIRVWSNDKKKSSNNSRVLLKEELDALDVIIDKGEGNEDVVNKRNNVVNVLQDMEKLKSMEAAQKAKIKWAIEGDENSKYYHGILNKKRSRLTIRGILVDGSWIDSPNIVKNEFLSHFKNRFDKPQQRHLQINMTFPHMITADQKADLECDVLREEIKRDVLRD
ncbi:hypothetical protein Tco_0441468 [Tanacetum coccineum]